MQICLQVHIILGHLENSLCGKELYVIHVFLNIQSTSAY